MLCLPVAWGWRALRWPGGARSADEQPHVTLDVPIPASRRDDEGLAAFDVDGLGCAPPSARRRRTAPRRRRIRRARRAARRQKFHAEEGRCLLGQHLHPARDVGAGVPRQRSDIGDRAVLSTTDSATSRERPRKTSSSEAVVLVRSNRIDWSVGSCASTRRMPGSDGVRGSAGHQNAVTRPHRHPVHECQHRLGVLRLYQLREPVLADLFAPPDPHRRVVVGFQDVPRLGLAVGAAEVLRGVLPGGMHVHGQALAGIQVASPAHRCHPALRRRGRASRGGRREPHHAAACRRPAGRARGSAHRSGRPSRPPTPPASGHRPVAGRARRPAPAHPRTSAVPRWEAGAVVARSSGPSSSDGSAARVLPGSRCSGLVPDSTPHSRLCHRCQRICPIRSDIGDILTADRARKEARWRPCATLPTGRG